MPAADSIPAMARQAVAGAVSDNLIPVMARQAVAGRVADNFIPASNERQ